jgi:hypothetical protein
MAVGGLSRPQFRTCRCAIVDIFPLATVVHQKLEEKTGIAVTLNSDGLKEASASR